ncbi:hypothetical protein O3M35_007121 [Rhynocoris fuscipes]|uniref:Uncharacterized protein n=1 Tax=Rhynocoris fuscipes TaxID=488301 RepID=A0AAW1DDI8_9HEMI
MALRRKDQRDDGHEKLDAAKITESVTQQLLGLRETFTKVLHAVIEKDCVDIGDSQKAVELTKIKEKYITLKDEVCRIISEFSVNMPVTREESVAVREGLTQCMTYISGVHKSMESILRKYDVIDEKRCCDNLNPHLHKIVDGVHVIIKLNQGTRNEMDYVNRLINNVKNLPKDKRKKLFNKICNFPELEDELGSGDDSRKIVTASHHALTLQQNIPKKFDDSTGEETSQASIFHSKITQNVYSISNSMLSIESPMFVPSIPKDLREKRYFPEKVIENLVAGYSWGDCLKSGDKKSETIKENLINLNGNNNKVWEKSKTLNVKSISSPSSCSEKNSSSVHSKSRTLGSSEKSRSFEASGNSFTNDNAVALKNAHDDLSANDNKRKSELNRSRSFDSNNLPLVNSLSEPLYEANGEPLLLYNHEGIPLTDNKGYVLKLFNGKYAVIIDENRRLISDAFGRPLYNRNSQQITDLPKDNSSKLLTSSRKPSITSFSEFSNSILYNKKGFLPTDSHGKPLDDKQGKPLIVKEHESGAIMDSNGYAVYDTNGSSERKILSVYDGNKYPLTDEEGNVLRTVEGEAMVVFDKTGKPVKDCFNRVVYDFFGNPSTSPKFDPYRKPTNIGNSSKLQINIQVYDFRGYPLLDSNCIPLATADGRCLIETNCKGNICHDLNGFPLFDKRGIPLTKINNCWTTPHGEPYRIFNGKGFPLTTEKGEDLFDINGEKLIGLDAEGRPVETASGEPVYDASGLPPTHQGFSPGKRLAKSAFTRKVYMENSPMKVYNKNGLPLTDPSGTALLDAKGTELMQFDDQGVPIRDSFGDRIYDEFKVPLNCKADESIISMNDKPFRIYDKQGRPLTDLNGLPLNLANGMCMIKFDNAGRPASDFRNSQLFDFNGKSLQDPQANAEFSIETEAIKLVKRDGTPVQVYNREGMPLTDAAGIMLINSDGTHLCLNNDKYPVSDWNGDPVFNELGQPLMKPCDPVGTDIQEELVKDIFGRPMKDAIGEPQFDEYGRPLYDLYRRRLFDEQGRPIANAYGRYLTTNLPEPKLVDLGFDPNIILNTRANPTTASLTDLIGGPLFDFLGMPLYNQYGKPLIDIYGRPLYDSDGLPLCDAVGRPVSELVRQYGVPIDVKDVYKLIEVNKEVTEMINNSVVRTKKPEIPSSPSGIWILPSNINSNGNSAATLNPEKKLYWALLRMSTFSDGRKSFEILEAKPYDVER